MQTKSFQFPFKVYCNFIREQRGVINDRINMDEWDASFVISLSLYIVRTLKTFVFVRCYNNEYCSKSIITEQKIY